MKKTLFLILSIILFSSLSSAQSISLGGGDLSYTGFTLNYAYQDVHTDVDVLKTVWSGKGDNLAHGFNVGFHVQQNLYKGLILVSGIQYQFTGRINKDIDFVPELLNGNTDVMYFNHNLIVPIKFGYSFKFGGTGCFSIYGGPSLNFIVSTMEHFYVNSDNYLYTDWVNGRYIKELGGHKQSGKESDLKQMGWFDIPLGVGAVVKFGRYGLHFEYEWGMVDRWLDKDIKGKYRADQLTAGLIVSF